MTVFDREQTEGVNMTTGEPHYSPNALPSSGCEQHNQIPLSKYPVSNITWKQTGEISPQLPDPISCVPAALTLLAARKSLIEIISPDILRPLSVSLSLTASVSMEGSLRARR